MNVERVLAIVRQAVAETIRRYAAGNPLQIHLAGIVLGNAVASACVAELRKLDTDGDVAVLRAALGEAIAWITDRSSPDSIFVARLRRALDSPRSPR